MVMEVKLVVVDVDFLNRVYNFVSVCPKQDK